jgi:hypothetical protein
MAVDFLRGREQWPAGLQCHNLEVAAVPASGGFARHRTGHHTRNAQTVAAVASKPILVDSVMASRPRAR